MGLSPTQWSSLATSAAEQSPDEWKILGTGAKTTIVRPGIEWRIQLVGYDPTGSSGTIFAYDAKLVRPVSRVASLTGDGGTFDGRFRPQADDAAARENYSTPTPCPRGSPR